METSLFDEMVAERRPKKRLGDYLASRSVMSVRLQDSGQLSPREISSGETRRRQGRSHELHLRDQDVESCVSGVANYAVSYDASFVLNPALSTARILVITIISIFYPDVSMVRASPRFPPQGCSTPLKPAPTILSSSRMQIRNVLFQVCSSVDEDKAVTRYDALQISITSNLLRIKIFPGNGIPSRKSFVSFECQ